MSPANPVLSYSRQLKGFGRKWCRWMRLVPFSNPNKSSLDPTLEPRREPGLSFFLGAESAACWVSAGHLPVELYEYRPAPSIPDQDGMNLMRSVDP